MAKLSLNTVPVAGLPAPVFSYPQTSKFSALISQWIHFMSPVLDIHLTDVPMSGNDTYIQRIISKLFNGRSSETTIHQ